MARSTISRGSAGRRALLALLGVAVATLGLVAVWRLGIAPPGAATAATRTPGAGATVLASPAVVTPTPTVAPATEPPPTPIPTPQTVPAPLTGLPVSPEAALQRPIAVMVDDHPDARPQSGFNAAAIVWHAPAEGGVPRYMLVFQDQVPGEVGPVRSARQYYVEWAAELEAMFLHHGGSPGALATLAAKGNGQWVWNADGFRWEGRYLWRTDRLSPHDLYTDGENMRKLAARLGAEDAPVEASWSFGAPTKPVFRPDGGSITVTYPYASVTYRYVAVTNRYERYVDGAKKPQVDQADGQVVAPTNVVILRMAFGPLNDGHPEKFRLEAHNVGKGVAWIATNGRTVKGTWSKKSVTAPTLLFGPDGSPIRLTAGQTFIQVLPLSDSLKMVAGGPSRWTPPHPATHSDPV